MSRKRTISCDRCGFTEEESAGEYVHIKAVSMAFGPVSGNIGQDFFDAQDMCPGCRENVKSLLLPTFKKKGQP